MLLQYVNHTHSDYHELWLVTGWPDILLIAVFLGWYLWRSVTVWVQSAASPGTLNMARAASIAIAVVLAQSWVDYPLRVLPRLRCSACAARCRMLRLRRAVQSSCAANRQRSSTLLPVQRDQT
ncbi:MAG: hypothetical protein ACYDC8_16760 [Gammaproteobacteria bacterium]